MNETPGPHFSAAVEKIPCLLLCSLQVRQRNEFFTAPHNISTPPRYFPYGEPYTKREENTHVTSQLLANHLAFLVLLLWINHHSINSCLLSAKKVLHMQNLVMR